jgi:FkbM family methyltransferase
MTKIEHIINALSESPQLHAHNTFFYKLCKGLAREIVERDFSDKSPKTREFEPFGSIAMPYIKMGNIDSKDLFGLDELIIFAFYYSNRGLYKRALDIGANLGLHSMIMSRCGFTVEAFEPDPWHFGILSKNLILNKIYSVKTNEAAVSFKNGNAEFVRVLGNTTGSHLAGAKDSYGEKEIFQVNVREAGHLFDLFDFAKIDAEGHEKEILSALTSEHLAHLDIMVEVGNSDNATFIYDHIKKIGGKMFSQKTGWSEVKGLDEVPTSHREGSLFITLKSEMPWKN